MEYAMSIRNHFVRDRSQKFPIVTWLWEDGEAQTTYIMIWVGLVRTIREQDILAFIINNGEHVKILINFPGGGELTNPEHLLRLNREYADYSELHPQYSRLAMAHRHASDAILDGDDNDEDSFELYIDLPFECEQDLIDPFLWDNDALSVGIFPLSRSKYGGNAGAPPPSVKLLHLTLEEKKKKRAHQRPGGA